jgi:hypothetical protein
LAGVNGRWLDPRHRYDDDAGRRPTWCDGDHSGMRIQDVERQYRARGARSRVMREMPLVIAQRLHVRGQAKAAALRQRSNRDPALRKNGKRRRKPPYPTRGGSNPRRRPQHPYLMVHPHPYLRTSLKNATRRPEPAQAPKSFASTSKVWQGGATGTRHAIFGTPR